MNSTPISRKPYDAYKSRYEGMADALSGWGLFREGHFRQREQYLCTGNSRKFAMARAESRGATVGQGGETDTPRTNSCSAVVPWLHLVHCEALEVHPDRSWSLLTTAEWAGRAQRREARSGCRSSSAGGKDSGPALAMRARREGWHALTRAAGQAAVLVTRTGDPGRGGQAEVSSELGGRC